MTVQRQIGFWIAAVVTVLLLFVLRGILLPFVAGFALAYLLDPLADRLQKVGIGRLGASLILVLFVLILIISLMILVPFAAQQVAAFVERLPGYVTRLQELGTEQLGLPIGSLGEDALPQLPSVGNLIGQGIAWIAAFLQGLWSGGQALLGIFSLLVVTPVVAFYMLIDWDRMVKTVDSGCRRVTGTRSAPSPRHRPGHRGLCPGPGHGLHHSRNFLRGESCTDRAEFRRADRHDGRHPELHSLCGFAHGPDPVCRRRHRAVLAGLDHDRPRSASSSSASSWKATSSRRSWWVNLSACIRSGSCSLWSPSAPSSASSGCCLRCRSLLPSASSRVLPWGSTCKPALPGHRAFDPQAQTEPEKVDLDA